MYLVSSYVTDII